MRVSHPPDPDPWVWQTVRKDRSRPQSEPASKRARGEKSAVPTKLLPCHQSDGLTVQRGFNSSVVREERAEADETGEAATRGCLAEEHPQKEEEEVLCDMFGAVVVDAWGRAAAGVSSGGIALKSDGRVGEAAMFGCGCWAMGVELGPGGSPGPEAKLEAAAVAGGGSALPSA